MPTVTLTASSCSEKFPVGTVVGVYAPGSRNPGYAPTAAAIATGTVDAAGALSVTNAGILQGVTYELYAAVGGVHTYLRARSTLDVSDTGRAAGTGTLTTGFPAIDALTATSGAFAVGQRIRTITALASIPAGTFIKRLASSVAGKAVTGDTAGVFTSAGHGYLVGDPVKFSALTGGTGITAGTVYYVTTGTANTFTVSATPGGPTLAPSTALTVGTVSGVAVMSENAGTTGAANLEADGASPARVPPNSGAGALPVPVAVSTWQAKVRQRRILAGTEG